MTSLLAGIDLSTRALHAALIPYDPTLPLSVEWRVVDLPRFKAGATTSQYRSVQRCRAIRGAVRELLTEELSGREPTSVWVEEPVGTQRCNELRELYGAILASIPPRTSVGALSSTQWRKTICEAWNVSPPARGAAKSWALRVCDDLVLSAPDEHYADALLIALAGRHHEWRPVCG